jgi:Transposase DDE domain
MSGKTTLERFITEHPLAVMTRCIADLLLNEELDAVFHEHRTRQYEDTIKFSVIARSMAEIALGTVANRNQAYREYQAELRTTKEAYYGKVNRTEPSVSEEVVAYSARRADELLTHLRSPRREVLAGYRCYALDGNHLRKTEKRLPETRGLCAAPLPGTVVARLDQQTQLFDRAYLLEDAHAQESSVLDRVLADLAARDLVIADRHFCIVDFLLRLAAQAGCFLIRQHGRLKGELLGKRQYVGRTATGMVYEQPLKIRSGDHVLVIRRLTVCLNEPTRDGDRELHILSNVPVADADGCVLADLYRRRWEIENGFYLLTMTLTCEMASNCHPRCALLLFCMAMVAYNCRQVLLAGLSAEHDPAEVEQISQYQVALDVVRPQEGMLTAISEREWRQLVPRTVKDSAAFLRRVSRRVNLQAYRKSVRGPKKPPPPRQRCKAGTHVATAQLLHARKVRC